MTQPPTVPSRLFKNVFRRNYLPLPSNLTSRKTFCDALWGVCQLLADSCLVEYGYIKEALSERFFYINLEIHTMNRKFFLTAFIAATVTICLAAQSSVEDGIELKTLVRNKRENFLRDTVNRAFSRYGGRCNVLMYNALSGRVPHAEFHGIRTRYVVYYGSFHRIPYRVVVFRSGTFIRQGDGGFINWRFRGSFRRSGSRSVTFFRRGNC